jgi:hypothetical protein
MVGFRQRWDELESLLKANADYFGVPVTSIAKGAFEQTMPSAPPFIYIGMMPGWMLGSQASNTIGSWATVEIFCAVGIDNGNAEALIACHDLCAKVLATIETKGKQTIRKPAEPIVPDTIAHNIIAFNIQFAVEYDLYADT